MSELTRLDKIAIQAVDGWNHSEGDDFLQKKVVEFGRGAECILADTLKTGGQLPPITEDASLFARWGRTRDDTLLFFCARLVEPLPQEQVRTALEAA